MPVVHVYMFEERTVEQKRKIVAGITQAMVEGAGISRDSTQH